MLQLDRNEWEHQAAMFAHLQSDADLEFNDKKKKRKDASMARSKVHLDPNMVKCMAVIDICYIAPARLLDLHPNTEQRSEVLEQPQKVLGYVKLLRAPIFPFMEQIQILARKTN